MASDINSKHLTKLKQKKGKKLNEENLRNKNDLHLIKAVSSFSTKEDRKSECYSRENV